MIAIHINIIIVIVIIAEVVVNVVRSIALWRDRFGERHLPHGVPAMGGVGPP